MQAAGEQFLLKGLVPAQPANLGDFVRDRATAVALGKALFWDMQTGGDGIQACASCHFHAGVDDRVKNTLAPGANGAFFAFTDGGGPNSTVQSADFPFHKLSDPDNNASAVIADADDIVGSQGVHKRDFVSLSGTAVDNCVDVADAVFHVGPVNTRRVTGRNAPSVIGAAFNFRNFWDGRAREVFNGVDPTGLANPNAVIFRTDANGIAQPVAVQLKPGSAASQSVLRTTRPRCRATVDCSRSLEESSWG
jgi:hypothetical protein